MNPLLTIILKEIRDNLRDTRSLFFTLLYGPVLMPLLMIGPLVFTVEKQSIDFEQPQTLHVAGIDQAPNLVQYLKSQNLDAVKAGKNYRKSVRSGSVNLVLEVPTTFGQSFSSGEPAPLIIHYNSAEDESVNEQRRLKSALEGYNQRIRRLRYLARGIDEKIFRPLIISESDLSASAEQNNFVGLMLPFLLIFSMMMGGFYLAVDTTAGERERLSLEPLLGLPVLRSTMVLGKYGAILFFVLVAMVLPLLTSFALFSLLSNEQFTSTFNLSAGTFWLAGFVHLPVAFLLTSVLFLIAVVTRSTKEAQTHLGMAMMVPMIPFFALQFLNIPSDANTLLVPLLSQYQIMEQQVMGESVPVTALIGSALSTLALALFLLLLSIRLYRREKMLQ